VPVLATADGTLELVVVQPPGKRPMPGGDYLRGRR
jgi:methionyl-tRNA formyltransferase